MKYECTRDKCEKITSDFQHAESFSYDSRTSRLGACLWTNCYEAKAHVITDRTSGQLTAIGRLRPSAHRGNEPIVVSITIDKAGAFNAVWDYGSQALTFDMGMCKRGR